MFFCFNLFKKNNDDNNPLPSAMPLPSPTPTNTIINMWSDLKPIQLSKIRSYVFPETKYFHDEYNKTQITLHHTISGPGVDGDIETWIKGKHNVGTSIIVDRLGIPWQIFPSKYWAYHLGSGNHSLDKHSIGIEIDNWGGLVLGDGENKMFNGKWVTTIPGKYYAYYGNVVNVMGIQEYLEGYRGYNYFEKYTTEQIKTVGELLLFWKNKYNIPLYKNPGMFNISQDALGGKPGVWSHTSYRTDKSDIHPQPEIIEMLNTISTDEMPVSFKLKRKWFNWDRKKGYDVA